MLTKDQEYMLEKVLKFTQENENFVGLAIGGSYITKTMDEYSDLDFVLVTKNDKYNWVLENKFQIIKNFGEVLSSFSGEHVGEPRLVVSLFNTPSLLHVDFKFVSLSDVSKRVENPIILYQENNCLSDAFKLEKPEFPYLDYQWAEDHFWIWVHYVGVKIGRGELFEAIDGISFLRQNIISSLILIKNDKLPRGTRRIEEDAPEDINELLKTIPEHSKESCLLALEAIVNIYTMLQEDLDFSQVVMNEKAKIRVIEFIKKIKDNK